MREKGWWRLGVAAVALLALFASGRLGWYRARMVVQEQLVQESRRWLEGRVIVLDPGHGGHDPGAVSNGTEEKGIVLAIALTLKGMLEEQGATVVMTRETDQHLSKSIRQDLANRVSVIRQHQAHAFLSIHANKDACLCWGAQSFYQKGGMPAGKELALAVQSQLRRLTPTTRGALAADYYVLRTSPAPGTIVEVGFLSDRREVQRLKDPAYQRTLARAMLLGLADFFRGQVPDARSRGEVGQELQDGGGERGWIHEPFLA